MVYNTNKLEVRDLRCMDLAYMYQVLDMVGIFMVSLGHASEIQTKPGLL